MHLCALCIFSKAHKRSWRTNKSHKAIRKNHETRAGDGTSSDHLIYHQLVIVPQVSGKLTTPRFRGATFFKDHFSIFIHTVLFQGHTNDETLEAKKEYEKILSSYNHSIKSYRAENSRFNAKPFLDDCTLAGQNLTFCGMGAHHKTGIGESTIKWIVEDARVSLLHAKKEWPKVITTNL